MFVSCASVIKEITKMIDIQRELKLRGGYTCEIKEKLHEASRLWDLGRENLESILDVDQFFWRIFGTNLNFKLAYYLQTYKQRNVVNRRKYY
jgi:hypothetical protein